MIMPLQAVSDMSSSSSSPQLTDPSPQPFSPCSSSSSSRKLRGTCTATEENNWSNWHNEQRVLEPCTLVSTRVLPLITYALRARVCIGDATHWSSKSRLHLPPCLPTFCWLPEILYCLKGKQAQNRQKEEKARIILIG